jgi:hypothetical protein
MSTILKNATYINDINILFYSRFLMVEIPLWQPVLSYTRSVVLALPSDDGQ